MKGNEKSRMRSWKRFFNFSLGVAMLLGWSGAAFSLSDYIPGMEQFPDIDITHYDLRAEFQVESTEVKAKAIVTLELEEPNLDYIILEIDRRAKILSANDGEGNILRFTMPDDVDYVVIYLADPSKTAKSVKIELDYVCRFPPLQSLTGDREFDDESDRNRYFYLRKWYPVNDYYCDQAPADFTFTLPRNFQIITSGQEVSSEIQGDIKISRWRSFGSANYYFVFAGPFRQYVFADQTPEIAVYMDSAEPHKAKAAVEKAVSILNYYESLLCPYPYPILHLVTTHSKISPVGLNGLTYIDFDQFALKYIYSEWTWSHELAHHWFGGVVQAKTPEDYCLLMEGPAEYMSRLYIRSIKGGERFKLDLEAQRMAALAGDRKTPITKYYTLEKGGEFLYARGFYIFHMLRNIIGDEVFFRMMKTFVKEFYVQEIEIRDLEMLAERVHGQSLDWFFSRWVYETGTPEYELEYRVNRVEEDRFEVIGNISQKRVTFRMPVEVVAVSADREYTHRTIVEEEENPFRLELSFRPESVLLDPEYKILRWDQDIKIWIYTSMGRKLLFQKKYEQAERLFDRALWIDPTRSWPALERGNTAYLQDQYEMAIKYYSQALNGDLDFHLMPWPHEQIIQVLHLWLGICHDLLGRRQEAISYYQKTIAMGRHPRFSFYYDKAKEYLKKPASKKDEGRSDVCCDL